MRGNDLYSQEARNRRVTAALFAGFFLLLLSLGLGLDLYLYGSVERVGFPLATTIALSFAALDGAVSYFYGGAVVAGSLGARPPDIKNPSHRMLHNVVTEMALASGLPLPRILVMPEASPNALATGRGPGHAAIVVTEGLLERLDRQELEAVVAHEMGHIRNLDVLTMTVVGVLLGTVAILSDWALRTWRYSGLGPRRRGRSVLALVILALFIAISPVVARLIAMAVSRSREYQADAAAAEFTRDPLSLARALEKIAGDTTPLGSATRGTAHLFICDPLRRRLGHRSGRMADLLCTHPPVEKRIERLRRMACGGDQRAAAGTAPAGSPALVRASCREGAAPGTQTPLDSQA